MSRLRHVSLGEASERIRQAFYAGLEGLQLAGLPGGLAEHEAFKPGQGQARFSGLSMLASPALTMLPATGSGTSTPALDDGTWRKANDALRGRFHLLGLTDLDFGLPIDWHLEPTTGRRSPLVHWKRLDSLDTSRTGDKKIVWELNRHQHLVTLAQAFLSSGEERYAEAVGAQLSAWIRDNPHPLGINWVSSLELAFRSINWLWALSLLRDWARWNDLPLEQIARTIDLHARHIERFPSKYSSPNTHLTGEALGLYYVGTCLPELRRAERWRDIGRDILVRQLATQVYDDGMYFEQSTWYQRYTADFYLHFLMLAQRSGDALPEHVPARVTALVDYLMWITRPDGTSPLLGDDDGGTLLAFESRPANDWRTTLSNAAVMFRRADYKHVAGRLADETAWIMGPDCRAQFDAIVAEPPVSRSRLFADGGSCVMRGGWETGADWLHADYGPHGALGCGHSHADALSIELATAGRPIIVDPGTFTYGGSAALRDEFRSTPMHNTVSVDGQSSSVPGGLFKWRCSARTALRQWHDHDQFTFVSGSHDGYCRLQGAVGHSRSVLYPAREYWVILDRLEATGDHDHAVHWHFAPGVCAEVSSDARRITATSGETCVDVVSIAQQGKWEVKDGWISPAYGSRVGAVQGTLRLSARGNSQVLTVLYPRHCEDPALAVRSLEHGDGAGIALETSGFEDTVLWSTTADRQPGVSSHDFEWVWQRHDAVGKATRRIIAIHGTYVTSNDLELMADRQLDFLTVAWADDRLVIDYQPEARLSVKTSRAVAAIVTNGRSSAIGAGVAPSAAWKARSGSGGAGMDES